jgi:hypothetical protein
MIGFIKIGVNIINMNRVESVMILEDQINFCFDHSKGDESLQVISKNVVPENSYERLKKYITEDLSEIDFNKDLS